ncbi:hypothetical protein BsIDN1_09120 [Bacillus safensis]|uniref:Uncharacterized protein n=1 Tax=Bacillus safensis TaxID=561879 RepID=A0A5S9M558_BACIA|nr:hypothetical protein BsIDN1_09120 [Bacillus safensis]
MQEEEMTDEAGDLNGHLTAQKPMQEEINVSYRMGVPELLFWLRPLQAVSVSLSQGVSPSTRK